MKPEEISLLLAVARILRARIRESEDAERMGDLAALDEALKPFDPSPVHGGDFVEAHPTGNPT
jgi:hypothetical protein